MKKWKIHIPIPIIYFPCKIGNIFYTTTIQIFLLFVRKGFKANLKIALLAVQIAFAVIAILNGKLQIVYQFV